MTAEHLALIGGYLLVLGLLIALMSWALRERKVTR